MKTTLRPKLLPLMIATLLVSPGLLAADSLQEAVTGTKVSGNWRTMLMKTDNTADRQDWDAFATGLYLKLQTARWEGFTLGMSGYVTLDLDSNRTVIDPNTGRGNRYESGMFDLDNKNDDTVAMLGEAYLNWSGDKQLVNIGRMKLKTPLMNGFDGRMIPNLFEGMWYQNTANKGLKFQLGYITGIAVRATSEFKDLDQAIGTLSQGKSGIGGNNLNYKGNLNTDYVAIANVSYSGIPGTKLHLWNYYWDNVMNTTYLAGSYKIKGDKLSYTFAGQYINQGIVGDGGNKAEANSYVLDGFDSNTYGLKMTVAGYGAALSLATVEITDDGRFTKPREWGKDPLFTFQRRELGDGYGDSSAWLVRLKYKLTKLTTVKGLSVVIDHGQHDRPSISGPDKFVFNKYAFPSFSQTNVNLIYKPAQVKGLKLEMLLVHKVDDDNTGIAAFQQNKAETDHLSLIANYKF